MEIGSKQFNNMYSFIVYRCIVSMVVSCDHIAINIILWGAQKYSNLPIGCPFFLSIMHKFYRTYFHALCPLWNHWAYSASIITDFPSQILGMMQYDWRTTFTRTMMIHKHGLWQCLQTIIIHKQTIDIPWYFSHQSWHCSSAPEQAVRPRESRIQWRQSPCVCLWLGPTRGWHSLWDQRE